LLAGDDLTVPENTLVSSPGSVLLRVDAQAADGDAGIGGTVDIRGDVTAPQVEIAGVTDLDYLQLDNPNGINAGGHTLVRGHDSDARFFVRAVAGQTVLQGDTGADRFFLASNANKALFTTGGVYNDDDPLARLTGVLTKLGGIVVDAGTAGSGGT